MNNSDDESNAVSQVSISTCKEVNISDRSKWMWKMIKMDITAVPLQSGVQAPQWEFGGSRWALCVLVAAPVFLGAVTIPSSRRRQRVLTQAAIIP